MTTDSAQPDETPADETQPDDAQQSEPDRELQEENAETSLDQPSS